MEKQCFNIVTYSALPKPNQIEIGPEGILNGRELVSWDSIEKFCHHTLHENLGTMYITTYITLDGKTHTLNFHVSDLSDAEKKELYRSAYQAIFIGFRDYIVRPTVDTNIQKLNTGQELKLAGAILSSKGIEIRTGLFKRSRLLIPMDNVQIQRIQNSGGFHLRSNQNPAKSEFFTYEGEDARILLATLERLLPEQAAVYR